MADTGHEGLETRVRSLETQIATYKTAIVVAGVIFTGVLGWTAKSSYDAVRASLDPAVTANEEATLIINAMQNKRDQLDKSVAALMEDGKVEVGNVVAEISTGTKEVAALVEAVGERKAEFDLLVASFPVASFTVLSNDHASGNTGVYFNFDARTVSTALGRSDWHCHVATTLNGRTGVVAPAVFWKNANGGSVGDSHGRYEPASNATANDWQGGDQVFVLHLAGKRGNC